MQITMQITNSTSTSTINFVSKANAIKLEIAFNLTDKGRIWSHIGDALYYYKDIQLTDEQFLFLQTLMIEKNISL